MTQGKKNTVDHATHNDTLPPGTETVEAGKITLHRSPQGVVWFRDRRGLRVTVDDRDLGEALIQTAKNGPGAEFTVERKEGVERPINVEVRTGPFSLKPPM